MGVIPFLASSLWLTAAAVLALGGAAVAVASAAFGLSVGGAVALYFVVWWTALFAILPINVRSQHETGDVVPGTEPGAPSAPLLREKAIWTTLVSDLVFVGAIWVLPLAGL
jgi:predicted secreted protein